MKFNLKRRAYEYHAYSLFKQQKLHENPTSTDIEVDATIDAEFFWWFKKVVRT